MILKPKKTPSVRFTSSAYTATPKLGSVFTAVVKGQSQNNGKVFAFIKTPQKGSN